MNFTFAKKSPKNYSIDCGTNLYQNGYYDAPPTGHACRFNFDDEAGDTTLTFEHYPHCTAVRWITTSTDEIFGLKSLHPYPNPVISDIILTVELEQESSLLISL